MIQWRKGGENERQTVLKSIASFKNQRNKMFLTKRLSACWRWLCSMLSVNASYGNGWKCNDLGVPEKDL